MEPNPMESMKSVSSEAILTRHTDKPAKKDATKQINEKDLESEEYEGISEKGVESSQKKSKELLERLEQSPNGTIMFIGGKSEMPRTGSTAEVYGDEMKRLVEESGKDNIIVLTEEDIRDEKTGVTGTIRKVQELINSSPDKKFIIDFPLILNEFKMGEGRWMKDGDYSPFTKELLKRNNNDEVACVRDWFANEGKVDDLEGPNPTEVAESHIGGIERLNEFAKKQISDRPIIIGMVGHSWNLDAVATYLANEGKITPEGFEKTGGKMIAPNQSVEVVIEDGKAKLKYGGKEFEIPSVEKGEEKE